MGADGVMVWVARAHGSTPREAGAWMWVGPARIVGTIGGGQLEHMAIDAARAMLRRGEISAEMDVPLGPAIGQCCGGRVLLRLERASVEEADARRAAEAAQFPQAWIFGAGHVGKALGRALALTPVRAALVDQREAELAEAADCGVALHRAAIPEALIRSAAPGAAFVILTHDHALDFLLAAEALGRADAAYVGMIGSATKRAQFDRFARARGVDPAGLTCPIAAPGGDKRPAVIAALAAAEIMRALFPAPAALRPADAPT
ncbi:MAG: xanthine dehydrogenase accessory protein XdhC [Rubrimonas sp.]